MEGGEAQLSGLQQALPTQHVVKAAAAVGEALTAEHAVMEAAATEVGAAAAQRGCARERGGHLLQEGDQLAGG